MDDRLTYSILIAAGCMLLVTMRLAEVVSLLTQRKQNRVMRDHVRRTYLTDQGWGRSR